MYRWHEGENRTTDNLSNHQQTAIDLAEFLLALQSTDTTGGTIAKENELRGEPLSSRDEATREAIDTKAVTDVWESVLQSPEWT